jgi:lysophospholipase L1-like esterase
MRRRALLRLAAPAVAAAIAVTLGATTAGAAPELALTRADPGSARSVRVPGQTDRRSTATARVLRYAALGDSYSSGEGNPPFDPDSGACHRSPAGWPRVVARDEPGIALVAHVACSGATSRALRHRFDEEPPQLCQLSSLSRPADLVTITIGGNDVGFARVLADCYLSDCVLDRGLARARSRIRKALPRLLARDYRGLLTADPRGTVLVVGYPQLFPGSRSESVGCPWLGDRERRTLNRLARLLDRTTARSARRAGLHYVSVLHALDHHELCTRRSWVYPIGPFGGQLRGHPLRAGQEAIAAVVRPRLTALR